MSFFLCRFFLKRTPSNDGRESIRELRKPYRPPKSGERHRQKWRSTRQEWRANLPDVYERPDDHRMRRALVFDANPTGSDQLDDASRGGAQRARGAHGAGRAVVRADGQERAAASRRGAQASPVWRRWRMEPQCVVASARWRMAPRTIIVSTGRSRPSEPVRSR
jgi:hypothetical protein